MNRSELFVAARRASLGAAALAAMCGSVTAGGPLTPLQVIYTKIPTHASSIVPGAKDLAGMPAVTNFRAPEILTLSPDGSLALTGGTQQGSDLETIVLMGSGLSGTAFAQEGQPIPTGASGELFDFFGSGFGKFNSNNWFAYSARARGGVAAVFHKVLVWDGVNQVIDSQMGDLYTGMSDLPPNPSGDETVGNSIGSIHILNDNVTIGSQDSTVLVIHTSRRPVTSYNLAKFKQPVIDTVTNLNGDGIEIISSPAGGNGFYTSPDGSRWVSQGTVQQPTTQDAVLIVDNKVEIQEGFAIPGSTTVVSTIVTFELKEGTSGGLRGGSPGDYYARGAINPSGVWAAKNGVLFARTGDAVGTGALRGSEAWGATFLAWNGNNVGDAILVGKTTNPDPAIDDVVAFYPGGDPKVSEVVIREGDPVDVDANGMFDDDAFIGRGNNTLGAFEPNDVALSDDGWLYIFANLRNAAGQDLNSNPVFGSPQVFLRVRLFAPVACNPAYDIDGDGFVNSSDLALLLGGWGPCALNGFPCLGDFDGDGSVGSSDYALLLGAWCN